jgi:hypothetical protein
MADETPDRSSLNPHEPNAQKVIETLHAAKAMIPRMQGLDKKQHKAMRTLLNVPIPFVEQASATVLLSPEIQSMQRLTPERALDDIQFLQAYLPVRNEIEALLKNVDYSLNAVKAELVSESLLVYTMAKALLRKNGHFAVFVRNMRRELGRSGRRKKKVKPSADGEGPEQR